MSFGHRVKTAGTNRNSHSASDPPKVFYLLSLFRYADTEILPYRCSRVRTNPMTSSGRLSERSCSHRITPESVITPGNKRSAAMRFLWFMEKNGILYAENGHKRIADNTLVALTLMIAESRTEEKDVMVKVVVNLINKDNQ